MIPHKLNPMGIDKNYPIMTFEKDGNLFDGDITGYISMGSTLSLITGGIRATQAVVGTYKTVYKKLNFSECRGRKLIVKGSATEFNGAKGRIMISFITNSGTNLGILASSLITSNTFRFEVTIPQNMPVGADHLALGINTSMEPSGSVGVYIDFTNIMISEEDIPYDPYNPNTYCVYGKSTQETRSLSKNLLDPNKILTGYSSYGGTTTNTTVVQNFLPNAKSYLIKVNAGNQYAISKQYVTNRFRYFFFVNNPIENPTEMSIGGAYPEIDTVTSFTIPTGGNWLFVVLTGDYTTYPVGWSQIELGSTATSYQPYVENAPSPSVDYPSYPVSNYPKGVYKTNIPSLPYIRLYDDLRGIGSYRDKIIYNKADGTKLLTKKFNLRIFNGTETLNQSGVSSDTNYYGVNTVFENIMGVTAFGAKVPGLCSHGGVWSYSIDAAPTWGSGFIYNINSGNQANFIRLPRTIANSVAEVNTWLTTQYNAGTPFAVCYLLATPINQYL